MMFVGTNAFRDLKTDIGTEWKDAMERGRDNPLFVGSLPGKVHVLGRFVLIAGLRATLLAEAVPCPGSPV